MSDERIKKLGSNSIFSDEEKAKRLTECYNSGMKWREIEELFGISHGACYNALKALGVLQDGGCRSRRLTTKKCEILVNDYLAGTSIEELAEKFGVSESRCRGVLRQKGVSCGYSRLFNNVSNLEELKKDYISGMSWKAIQKKYGCNSETCRRHLREAGVLQNRKREVIINDEVIARCIEDYKSGISVESISRKYNLPIARVYSILKETGVFKRKELTAVEIFENEEIRKAILQCNKEGYLLIDMAKRFDIDGRTIHKVLEMANEPLVKNKRRYSKEEKAQIQHLYLESKMSISEIAVIVNDSEYSVARFLKSLKIELRGEEGKRFAFVTRSLSKEDKAQIIRLYKSNYKIFEIVKILDLTYWQVKNVTDRIVV